MTEHRIRDLMETERELFDRWKGDPPRGFRPFTALRSIVASRIDRLPELGLFDRLNGLMLLVYQALFRKHDITPRGVINVGAHTGAELQLYLMLGFTRVLLIEPHPYVQELLRRRVAEYNAIVAELSALVDANLSGHNAWADPWCTVVQCAAGAREGEADLRCTADSTLSTLLDIAEDAADDARLVERVRVPVRPIDALMRELPASWQPEELNVFWANVQGAERDVLEGARSTLRHLDLVTVELNYDTRYVDVSQPRDVDALLRKSGLLPTFGIGVPEGGMRLYARARGNAARYQAEEGEQEEL